MTESQLISMWAAQHRRGVLMLPLVDAVKYGQKILDEAARQQRLWLDRSALRHPVWDDERKEIVGAGGDPLAYRIPGRVVEMQAARRYGVPCL